MSNNFLIIFLILLNCGCFVVVHFLKILFHFYSIFMSLYISIVAIGINFYKILISLGIGNISIIPVVKCCRDVMSHHFEKAGQSFGR